MTTSTSAGTSGNPAALSTPRRVATTTLAVLGAVTMASIAVQIGLAALGAFGGGFSTHVTFGYVIGLLTLLMLLAALVARHGKLDVALAAGLFVLAGPVQPLLATYGHTSPWVGALHGLDAAVIFALTGRLTFAAFQRRARG